MNNAGTTLQLHTVTVIGFVFTSRTFAPQIENNRQNTGTSKLRKANWRNQAT